MTRVEGVKTEKTYRAVKMDSSSSLKDFSLDRKKYYRKYILGETVEDEESKASVMGKIVETLLLEPDEFDNRFFMSSVKESPTGLMLAFVEALYKHTAAATNGEGTVTREFMDICKDAHQDSGFKWSFEKVMEKFIGSDNQVYYQEIRQVRSKGLTVITDNESLNGEKIVEELKTNFATAQIVNLVNSSRYSVFNQFQIEGYELDGHLFKSMIDKVVVDHEKKTVQPYDLKCVWSVENFLDEYYMYRRAYIQAYLYYRAIFHALPQLGATDYEILIPKFIVCDSINYYNPLIYTLSQKDMDEAYNGFEYKGRNYPGVYNIIKDLKWATANDTWNISRENYESGGLVNLRKNG